MKAIIITFLILGSGMNVIGQSLNLAGGFSISNTDSYYKGSLQSGEARYLGNYSENGTTQYESDYFAKNNNIYGWNAQLSYEYQIKRRLAIETGFLVSTKGYEYIESYTDEDLSEPFTEKEVDEFKIVEKFTYMDIPVNLKFDFYHDKVRIYGKSGLYGGICLVGDSTYSERHEYTSNFGNSSSYVNESGRIDIKKRDLLWNAGLQFGFGVEFYNIFLEGSYCFGLANLSMIDDVMYIRKDIRITLGYNLKFKKQEKPAE